MTSLISLMPVNTALNDTNSECVIRAMSRASVVFPQPGGPHRIIEPISSCSICDAQRLARPEQRFLSGELVERARAHPLRQGLPGARVVFRLKFCKEAHVCCCPAASLCRMASYSNVLAAIAALSDSIPTGASAGACGMNTRASAARTNSAGKPEPSLPIRIAEGDFQSMSHGGDGGEAAPDAPLANPLADGVPAATAA